MTGTNAVWDAPCETNSDEASHVSSLMTINDALLERLIERSTNQDGLDWQALENLSTPWGADKA